MEKHLKFSIWYVLIGIWIVLIAHNYIYSLMAVKTIPYSQFLSLLNENKVKEVVARVLKIEESDIGDDSNFIFDLGADSMQSLELVAAFEEAFDIEMDEDKALEIQNIADAVDFIHSYLP